MQPASTIDHTAEIVSAYVANNRVPASELPSLLASVHAALSGISAPPAPNEPSVPEVKKPSAAEIRRSIKPDALISFEDGKAYQVLRRHLGLLGLTPDAYRAKWGLPADYPMTSAAYAAKRSALAKQIGLGSLRRKK